MAPALPPLVCHDNGFIVSSALGSAAQITVYDWNNNQLDPSIPLPVNVPVEAIGYDRFTQYIWGRANGASVPRKGHGVILAEIPTTEEYKTAYNFTERYLPIAGDVMNLGNVNDTLTSAGLLVQWQLEPERVASFMDINYQFPPDVYPLRELIGKPPHDCEDFAFHPQGFEDLGPNHVKSVFFCIGNSNMIYRGSVDVNLNNLDGGVHFEDLGRRNLPPAPYGAQFFDADGFYYIVNTDVSKSDHPMYKFDFRDISEPDLYGTEINTYETSLSLSSITGASCWTPHSKHGILQFKMGKAKKVLSDMMKLDGDDALPQRSKKLLGGFVEELRNIIGEAFSEEL